MNNGIVNGSAHVGGLVGLLYPNIEPNRVAVVMEKSANKGTILSSSSMAWGFFFVVQGEGVEENIYILNCINKGSVIASGSTYGIANTVTKARNAVSMGNVTGLYLSYSFWNSSVDADMVFGLNDTCASCSSNTKRFKQNTKHRVL